MPAPSIRLAEMPHSFSRWVEFFGGSHRLEIPGECSVTSKGAALLKLFHYALGGPPGDISSYHLHGKKGKLRVPKRAAYPDPLQQRLTPQEVLQKMGCPDWIDLGRGTIWDYYWPLPDGLVARTTLEWGPEGKMKALERVKMGGKQVAERANHIIASGGWLRPGNPPKILGIQG